MTAADSSKSLLLLINRWMILRNLFVLLKRNYNQSSISKQIFEIKKFQKVILKKLVNRSFGRLFTIIFQSSKKTNLKNKLDLVFILAQVVIHKIFKIKIED